ncbi:MAG: hypothetical protein NC086_05910 [Alistipes sp.]|nr:hypothetical protein [Alistipes sp.]
MNRSYDIQVDNKQKIKTTLRVLSENIQGLENWNKARKVRIKNSGRQISDGLTYEEARIYTGMELTVMIEKEG